MTRTRKPRTTTGMSHHHTASDGTYVGEGEPLLADDFDDPAPRPRAVELDEEHTLPGAEAEVALRHRDRLSGRAHEHRHAVRMPVAVLHVLRADVLRAAVPIVV